MVRQRKKSANRFASDWFRGRCELFTELSEAMISWMVLDTVEKYSVVF